MGDTLAQAARLTPITISTWTRRRVVKAGHLTKRRIAKGRHLHG